VSATKASAQRPRQHVVRFYDSDDELLDLVAGFVRAGLRAGDAVLLVATREHREALAARLPTGAPPEQLRILDASELLETFSAREALDPELFDDNVGGVVRTMARDRPVRIFGEMVALLWERGAVTAALDLERLWNDLATRVRFALLCAYPQNAAESGSQWVVDVCAEHDEAAGPARRAAGRTRHVFGRSATAPAEARSVVVRDLVRHGDVERLDDIALATSELVANAVIHGGSDVTVALEWTEDAIRLSVADRSPRPPRPLRAGVGDSRGRGLHIVEALAGDWGFERHGPGKVVWARFPRTAPGPGPG
jgi:anti-sigma regulatory factor (Ser/Thr protein kinase)